MTNRDRAVLTAVGAGRAHITCSRVPDLFIDGLCCCDQHAAHRLTRAGLVRPAVVGSVGQRVRAVLTAAGAGALGVAA